MRENDTMFGPRMTSELVLDLDQDRRKSVHVRMDDIKILCDSNHVINS